MASLRRIKVGQVLWSVERHRMGNTTMRTISVYPVEVVKVADDHIVAIWNNNRDVRHHRTYYVRDLRNLRVKRPETERNAMGQTVLVRKNRKSEGNAHA